mgnify:CR=1 FL=1
MIIDDLEILDRRKHASVRWGIIIGGLIIVFTLATIIYLAVDFQSTCEGVADCKSNIIGLSLNEWGDFFGGIGTMLAFVALIVTVNLQRIEIKQQQRELKISQENQKSSNEHFQSIVERDTKQTEANAIPAKIEYLDRQLHNIEHPFVEITYRISERTIFNIVARVVPGTVFESPLAVVVKLNWDRRPNAIDLDLRLTEQREEIEFDYNPVANETCKLELKFLLMGDPQLIEYRLDIPENIDEGGLPIRIPTCISKRKIEDNISKLQRRKIELAVDGFIASS